MATGFASHLVNFTAMNGGGKGNPYVTWNSQVRVGLSLNLMRRTPNYQIGITSTLFSFGSSTIEYSIGRFFAPNDINIHFGFNLMSLTKNEKSYIGPFAEGGLLNMGLELGILRKSCLMGFEAYVKNSTKIAIGIAVFDGAINLSSSNESLKQFPANNFFKFEISHSFPLRY